MSVCGVFSCCPLIRIGPILMAGLIGHIPKSQRLFPLVDYREYPNYSQDLQFGTKWRRTHVGRAETPRTVWVRWVGATSWARRGGQSYGRPPSVTRVVVPLKFASVRTDFAGDLRAHALATFDTKIVHACLESVQAPTVV